MLMRFVTNVEQWNPNVVGSYPYDWRFRVYYLMKKQYWKSAGHGWGLRRRDLTYRYIYTKSILSLSMRVLLIKCWIGFAEKCFVCKCARQGPELVITRSLITVQSYINLQIHYSDVIVGSMASWITGVSIGYSTVCSSADPRKHESSAPLVFVRRIHRWSVNSHKGPVTRKMYPLIRWRHHVIEAWWRIYASVNWASDYSN